MSAIHPVKNLFWTSYPKGSVDGVEQSRAAGFHDAYIYKIINKFDESVIQLEDPNNPSTSRIITEEETGDDRQLFKTARLREGDIGGEFEVRSILKGEQGPPSAWEYNRQEKTLVQNTAVSKTTAVETTEMLPFALSSMTKGTAPVPLPGTDPVQLWMAVGITPDSRTYFIKPVKEDICLTNMGNRLPIELYPPDPADATQHWILEPVDFGGT